MLNQHYHSWREALLAYKHPRVITMLFLGFSAGLPLYLSYGTLSLWLKQAGIDRGAITFFSWVGFAYGFKFLWAPLVDRLALPWLTGRMGQRRSWLILAQISVACCLILMATTDPASTPLLIALFAAGLAFSSATQDIVIDAYRVEAIEADYQGAMAATYQIGYRVAMIMGGAGAIGIAGSGGSNIVYDVSAWHIAYFSMAAFMAIGVITTLIIQEPKRHISREVLEFEAAADRFIERYAHLPERLQRILHWTYGALFCPFLDFFRRYGLFSLLFLSLIATYRISDVVLGVTANIFYEDMGFTLNEIAFYSKAFGVAMTLAGGVLGGLLVVRYGILRILFVGAFLSAATNLLFAYMAGQEKSIMLLAGVITADNLANGIAGTAFIAYMSGLTSVAYTATQYALFSSVMFILPKFIAGWAGTFVNHFGYGTFFVSTAIIGIPVLILILLAGRYVQPPQGETEAQSAD